MSIVFFDIKTNKINFRNHFLKKQYSIVKKIYSIFEFNLNVLYLTFMKLSTFSAKWLMNYYPPLLFNRVVIKRISKDYKEVDVVIKKSFLNKNLQGTIFGGTIFSAADPFYAMMYWQHFNLEGIKCEAWLKSAEIEYLKPGNSNLYLYFRLTDNDIEEARNAMKEKGKFEKLHTLNICNIKGEQISRVKTLVYLRIARGKSKGVF